MNTPKVTNQRNWEMLFPTNQIRTAELEKDLEYHSPKFGMRALEYVVFAGSLLTLLLFTVALFQMFHQLSDGFYIAIAILFITGSLVLHYFVRNRLIDAMATAICFFGVISFYVVTQNYWKLKDAESAIALTILLLVIVVISRKNLITILGLTAIFWCLYSLKEEMNLPGYTVLLLIDIFVIALFLLIFLEEQLLTRFPNRTLFLRHVKTGLFIALTSYLTLGFNETHLPDDKSYYFNDHDKTASYIVYFISYALIIGLAIRLFWWQYKRLNSENIPKWTIFLLPLVFFSIGWMDVNFAFFVLTFLAFLFTKYWFGIIASIVGLIITLLQFYYELHWTFLNKSLLLIGIGLSCFLLYYLLSTQKVSHE